MPAPLEEPGVQKRHLLQSACQLLLIDARLDVRQFLPHPLDPHRLTETQGGGDPISLDHPDHESDELELRRRRTEDGILAG